MAQVRQEPAMTEDAMAWEGLCPLGPECPFPSDPDWHIPHCGHGLEGHHHHWPPKSRGGKRIVTFICPTCHRKVGEGRYGNAVKKYPDGTEHYLLWDVKDRREIVDRVIGWWKPEEEQLRRNAGETEGGGRRLPDESGEALILTPGDPLARAWDNPEDAEAFGDDEAAPGGQASQIAVVPIPEEVPSFAYWSPEQLMEALPAAKEGIALESVPDEQLAALFAEADKRQAEGFLLKCRIVHTYRERHVQAWGESWIEQAYELFHVSRRTLEVYARLHEILGASANYLVEAVGPLTESRSLMRHIGRKTLEDGKVALEAAITHVAEYGEPPTVAALEHRLGEEGAEIKQDQECPEHEDGRHRFVCACGKEK